MHKTQGPQGLQGVDPEPEGLPPVYNHYHNLQHTEKRTVLLQGI